MSVAPSFSGIGSSPIAPQPFDKSIENVRRQLAYTAQTSNFEAWFYPPGPVLSWMGTTGNGARVGNEMTNVAGIGYGSYLALSCNEASLPGSSLATHDVNNDYTGVSQKHAYRRIYDDRADFTFYVKNTYFEVMFFENWLAYIVNEQFVGGLESPVYNYRVNYPNTYRGDIYINKFDRDFGGSNAINSFVPANAPYLQYRFLEAYPISINSIPVSYEASNILKVTVSFTFTRYTVKRYEYITPTIGGVNWLGTDYVDVEFVYPDGSINTVRMSAATYNTYHSSSSSVP